LLLIDQRGIVDDIPSSGNSPQYCRLRVQFVGPAMIAKRGNRLGHSAPSIHARTTWRNGRFGLAQSCQCAICRTMNGLIAFNILTCELIA
jgi:hypothetical protein